MHPAPGIIERIGADWDWIWVDAQHGYLAGYQEMLATVRACDLIDRPAFVRVPSHESGWISLALDTNAAGIIVPQVECLEDAKAVVKAAKFPPIGNRSYGGRRAIDFEGRLYSQTANTAKKLICQIESEGALDQAEKIAALPGVDGLFLGPDDMMLRRNIPMDKPFPRDLLESYVGRLVAACERHGKPAFMVGANEESLSLCLSLGVRYIVGGGDVSFLVGGSREAALRARRAASRLPSLQASPQPQTLY